MSRREVQGHGFSWEKDLMSNVYGATEEEIAAIPYTSEFDLPGNINKKDPGINLSIKVTNSSNTVCMADCLRVYDSVQTGRPPIHMTVVEYEQDDATNTKKLVKITEVDLSGSSSVLFGTLSRADIRGLDAAVKAVPQKRKPTPDEHDHMYTIRDEIQASSGAIKFNIKCNSTQSRLQCSFNRFQAFLEANPERVIATSTTGNFRGGRVTTSVPGGRRVFKKKT